MMKIFNKTCVGADYCTFLYTVGDAIVQGATGSQHDWGSVPFGNPVFDQSEALLMPQQ